MLVVSGEWLVRSDEWRVVAICHLPFASGSVRESNSLRDHSLCDLAPRASRSFRRNRAFSRRAHELRIERTDSQGEHVQYVLRTVTRRNTTTELASGWWVVPAPGLCCTDPPNENSHSWLRVRALFLLRGREGESSAGNGEWQMADDKRQMTNDR